MAFVWEIKRAVLNKYNEKLFLYVKFIKIDICDSLSFKIDFNWLQM